VLLDKESTITLTDFRKDDLKLETIELYGYTINDIAKTDKMAKEEKRELLKVQKLLHLLLTWAFSSSAISATSST
jgi:hypothetical protein